MPQTSLPIASPSTTTREEREREHTAAPPTPAARPPPEIAISTPSRRPHPADLSLAASSRSQLTRYESPVLVSPSAIRGASSDDAELHHSMHGEQQPLSASPLFAASPSAARVPAYNASSSRADASLSHSLLSNHPHSPAHVEQSPAFASSSSPSVARLNATTGRADASLASTTHSLPLNHQHESSPTFPSPYVARLPVHNVSSTNRADDSFSPMNHTVPPPQQEHERWAPLSVPTTPAR